MTFRLICIPFFNIPSITNQSHSNLILPKARLTNYSTKFHPPPISSIQQPPKPTKSHIYKSTPRERKALELSRAKSKTWGFRNRLRIRLYRKLVFSVVTLERDPGPLWSLETRSFLIKTSTLVVGSSDRDVLGAWKFCRH